MRILVALLIVALLSGIFLSKKGTKSEIYEMVEVETVKEENFIQVTAEVQSQGTIKITADEKKKFKQIFVKEGDSIKKGDPIVSLELEDANEDISKLSQDLELAKISLEKQLMSVRISKEGLKEAQVLFSAKAILEDDLKKAKFKYENDILSLKEVEQKVHQIKSQMDYIKSNKLTVITSTINGTVYKCPDVGFSQLSRDKQIIEVFNNENFNLVFYLKPSDFKNINVGMTVQGFYSEGEKKEIYGVVSVKVPYPDQDSIKKGVLRYKVVARITSEIDDILVGEKIDAFVLSGESTTRHYVPFNTYIEDKDNVQYLETFDAYGNRQLVRANFGAVKNGKVEVVGVDLNGLKVKVANNDSTSD
ncbi:hypothetical protein [Enterovibrio paralichthyis]|uniref:hypothetical protein n=1 Tax=Enterovibrio paralichthyis TaxID=2853805 RepID=UPI001C45A79F|nr:hypothetical protein [Enterovibrio paralichthyis]MBV7297253.1 hypothetical protein [Enterovibrio paralichthyis]